jgi:hypothetical protein
VRTKDTCCSMGTIYDPRELPGVSTASPGIGRGVTSGMRTDAHAVARYQAWLMRSVIYGSSI